MGREAPTRGIRSRYTENCREATPEAQKCGSVWSIFGHFLTIFPRSFHHRPRYTPAVFRHADTLLSYHGKTTTPAMQKRPPPRVWRIRWSLLVVPSSPALLSSQSSIPLLITPTNYEDFLAVDFLAVDFFAVDFRVLFFAADPDDFFVVFLVLFLVDFFVLFFAEDLVDFLLVFFVPLPVDFLPVDFLLDFLAAFFSGFLPGISGSPSSLATRR